MINHYKNMPSLDEEPERVVLPNVQNDEIETDLEIVDYYRRQLWKDPEVPSTDTHLHTQINLQRGIEIKQELMKWYPGWF